MARGPEGLLRGIWQAPLEGEHGPKPMESQDDTVGGGTARRIGGGTAQYRRGMAASAAAEAAAAAQAKSR